VGVVSMEVVMSEEETIIVALCQLHLDEAKADRKDGKAPAPIRCEWGRTVAAEEDEEPCDARAVRRVALHHPAAPTFALQVCAAHEARLIELTDPHEGQG